MCKLAVMGLAVVMVGCSAKDPDTTTPYYHVGTPTNSSSVNSWELNNEPYYTQPGANSGKPVNMPTVPYTPRYEPNDPTAKAVYKAIVDNDTVPVQYVAIVGHDGDVQIMGSVETATQRARVTEIARKVPGIHTVENKLQVAVTGPAVAAK